MQLQNILQQILAIDTSNSFLPYIVGRVQNNDYRGMHVSQHNRYDFDRVQKILSGIYNVAGTEKFRVPLGDDKGQRDVEHEQYYRIVDSVQQCSGVGTVNSLKKNFFVDFSKMGFLDRFDQNNSLIGNAVKRMQVHYAALKPMAVKLIDEENISITYRYKIFTEALDSLFSDRITHLAETLYYSKYKNDWISIHEFMFILSDNNQSQDKSISLLNSYRKLKSGQKYRVIELIKQYCNPILYVGDKSTKRDFGNWKNQGQQIFSLLKSTVYFDVTDNALRLNTGTHGIFSIDNMTRRPMRRLGTKREYFNKHGVGKRADFELDHIVPFSAAKNKEEFQLIDHWKNLVYLEKGKHREKTRKKDKHVILLATPKKITLNDFSRQSSIIAENGKDAFYAGRLVSEMEKHNKKIIREVYDDGNL